MTKDTPKEFEEFDKLFIAEEDEISPRQMWVSADRNMEEEVKAFIKANFIPKSELEKAINQL